MSRKGPDEKLLRILVVDDEENLRHMLSVLLQKHGYHVEEAENGGEALEMAIRTSYDFILCDIKMPAMEGTEFLKRGVAAGLASTVIMMSAYGSIETAVECMKEGAYDYISKPFKNDEILLVLKKAEERERLKAENERLKREIAAEYSFGNIISRNSRMREIFSLMGRVCDLKTTVLILGESGTGKELIARGVHFGGNRAKAPFIAVNCGAIPENLLESELFGHVKGAFTDAAADRAGLFEQADGGTLFLDEIGEMPLSLQVKLLRVLQEGEIRRVGAGTSRRVDVRVISATSKNLQDEVGRGQFREDLFYRLNVFTITIPPLRERMEDIPLLVDHFLRKHGEKMGRTGVAAPPASLKILMDYHWPGNVRELENCIERGLILCDNKRLEPECLPENLRGRVSISIGVAISEECLSIKQAEAIIERELIGRALVKTAGNRTHAAKLLEISLRGLMYKLKEYGIE